MCIKHTCDYLFSWTKVYESFTRRYFEEWRLCFRYWQPMQFQYDCDNSRSYYDMKIFLTMLVMLWNFPPTPSRPTRYLKIGRNWSIRNKRQRLRTYIRVLRHNPFRRKYIWIYYIPLRCTAPESPMPKPTSNTEGMIRMASIIMRMYLLLLII